MTYSMLQDQTQESVIVKDDRIGTKAAPAKGNVDVAFVDVIYFTKVGICLPCSNDKSE